MPVGDTLLKLSDFPFAYSVLAILFIWTGSDITQHYSLFLAFSGFIASGLSILDPAGKLIRFGRKRSINRTKKKEETTKQYEISTLDTRAISLEIDKIVGFVYFVFILLVFTLAIIFSPVFVDHLVLTDTHKITVCDETCVRTLGITIPLVLAVFLLIEEDKKLKKLDEEIEITGFYRYCIDLQSVTLQSKENLNRAIDQNDWRLANWWKSRLENEIEIEAGLEEQKEKRQVERLEKQFISYGELLTILTMAKMVAIDHPLSQQYKMPHILSIPEEENRLRETFAKSRYLFSQDLLNKYTEYEKNKQIQQGTIRATNISTTYSLVDLTEMEKIAQSEFDKIKKAYEQITDLEI